MDNLHRIVVGIDFGTTYTAVAWAEASNPNQIEIIKNWPTSGQLVGPQVPSEIAYSEEDRNVFSWGYNINPDRRKVNKMIFFCAGLSSPPSLGRSFSTTPLPFCCIFIDDNDPPQCRLNGLSSASRSTSVQMCSNSLTA